MRCDLQNLAIALAILAAGSTLACVLALRRQRKALSAQRQQIAELTARLAQAASAAQSAGCTAQEEAAEAESRQEETPETLAAIAAAVAAFLGRRARIRSLTPVPAGTAVSAWSQQGRAFVQSSHNFTPRR